MKRGALVASLVALLVACSSDDPATSSSSGSSSSSTSSSSGGGSSSGSTSSSGSSGSSGDAGGDATAPGKGSGGSGGATGASVDLPGCTSCKIHVPPSYDPQKPAPLLVALHGDEGPATGVPNVISLWTSAADAHGFIVLALACSADIGCANGNWSGWLDAQGYQITAQNMTTMNAQTTKAESLYDVDTTREYLAGYSGGAYVLGYFAQAQAARYRAVAFVAGGMPAWSGTGNPCPTTKIPGYFLGGDGDFRTSGQMTDTKNDFDRCMEETKFVVVTGADHGATIDTIGTGNGDAILTWMLTRP